MSAELAMQLAAGVVIALVFGYVLVAVGKYVFRARKAQTFAMVGVIGSGLSSVMTFDRAAMLTILPPILVACFFLWRYLAKGAKPTDKEEKSPPPAV